MPSFAVRQNQLMWPVGSLVADAVATLMVTLFSFCTFLTLELLLRKRWLAGAGVALVMAVINLGAENPRLEIPGAVFGGILVAIVAARFGLLALAGMLLAMRALVNHPLSLDFTLWYTPAALCASVFVVALALWAFRTSRGRTSEA